LFVAVDAGPAHVAQITGYPWEMQQQIGKQAEAGYVAFDMQTRNKNAG
jgi:hypothetical protein